MKDYGNYARIVEIKDWEDLYKKHNELFEKESYVFRGQKKAEWELTTSLDRLSEHIEEKYKPKLELFLLEEFKRRYHNYASRIPEKGNKIEWWAWMQHYGTPTRLLDCTYSFYVAVYFALEDLDNKDSSAVWAIDHDWLWKNFKNKEANKKLLSILEEDKHLFNENNFNLFDGKPNVLRLSPFLLNERQSVQQGCFLIPGRTDKVFIDNLIEFSGSEKELKNHCFQIVIPKDTNIRRDILKDLYRMNISRASLFPGLDGFAFSLRTIPFAMPELLNKEQKLYG